MRNSLLPVVVLLIAAIPLHGQLNTGQSQDPISGQYTALGFLFNPAFAAARDVGELHVAGQNVANSFDSLSAKSYGIAIHSILDAFSGGVGGRLTYVYRPATGRYVLISGGFAYTVWQEAASRLIIGGTAGFGIHEVRVGSVGSLSERRTAIWPDFGAGVRLQHNGLFLGVSAEHLGRPTMQITSDFARTIDDIYYLTGGYTFEVEGIAITPSFHGRYRSSSNFLTDFMVDANWEERFGIAAGFRTDLRRGITPNPSNPVETERLRQALVGATLGFQEQYFLAALYTYTLNDFVLDRSNLELRFAYRFRLDEPLARTRPAD